ncbi:MAG TPA: glycosyltransferase family 4 protein [Thermoplasmata archaeon]
MVYAGPYPHTGGLSNHIEMMTRGLEEIGHQVGVLSVSTLPRPIQALAYRPIPTLNRIARGLGSMYEIAVLVPLFTVEITRMVRKRNYDVVNAHHAYSGFSAALSRNRTKVPVILTVHTYLAAEWTSAGLLRRNSFFSRIVMRMEKLASLMASRIVAVDSRLKDHVVSFGVPPERVDVVHNPADVVAFSPAAKDKLACESFRIPQDKTAILCPRRLVRKNGVIYPVMALKHIDDPTGRLMLVYAGDGSELDAVNDLIHKQAMEKKVIMLGAVDHSRMPDLFRCCYVVVIPSIHSEGLEEATSISALEAMASGIPVVASAVGGLKEIIKDGYNGILVPPMDEKRLANGIARLLADRKLYEAIARNSLEYVREKHSYHSRATALASIATKCMKNRVD